MTESSADRPILMESPQEMATTEYPPTPVATDENERASESLAKVEVI